MTTERPVQTITETLGRLLLFLGQRPALPAPCGRIERPREGDLVTERVCMLGNGQMLLPGIAEPRVLSLNPRP